VDNVVAVQVAHRSCHLPEVEGGQTFLTEVFMSDLLEEAPMGCELEQKVYFGVIREEAIHLKYIGMVGVELHFYLLSQLRLHSSLLNLLLVYHFYS
jgi:hypothetical protein